MVTTGETGNCGAKNTETVAQVLIHDCCAKTCGQFDPAYFLKSWVKAKLVKTPRWYGKMHN